MVDTHDVPNMPASTFRSWVIGILFVVTGTFINQLFYGQYREIGIGYNVAQLLCVLPALIHHDQRLMIYHG